MRSGPNPSKWLAVGQRDSVAGYGRSDEKRLSGPNFGSVFLPTRVLITTQSARDLRRMMPTVGAATTGLPRTSVLTGTTPTSRRDSRALIGAMMEASAPTGCRPRRPRRLAPEVAAFHNRVTTLCVAYVVAGRLASIGQHNPLRGGRLRLCGGKRSPNPSTTS